MRPTSSAKSQYIKASGAAIVAGLVAGLAAVLLAGLTLGAPPVWAGPLLIADDAERYGDPEQDSPGSPGTAQRGPDYEGPSEDGTDSAPDAGRGRDDDAAPERPPGCNFNGGPLELFV